MTFTKSVHDLIESCNKNEDQTVNLAQEMTELCQQIMSMGDLMNEINHHMTELEKERSDPPSQEPSFVEIARTTSSAPNLVYTPSSPPSTVRIEKLEYKTSEVERERKLLQVKVTHSGISTSSPDIDLHVKGINPGKIGQTRDFNSFEEKSSLSVGCSSPKILWG